MRKSFALSALALVFAVNAFASHIDVAPSLKTMNVTEVGQIGEVLKTKNMLNTQEILVGIPVSVLPDSACHSFAGQSSKLVGNVIVIDAVQSYSVMNDVCMAVMPRPVETTLTFKFIVGASLPVAVLNAPVQINNRMYVATLDLFSQRVTITPR